ncbi:thymidylate synthase [Candidatus Woesearchaeota archaeon]|nr:thymidylate synthase [Candidatus Woesearchaeota archaeon]
MEIIKDTTLEAWKTTLKLIMEKGVEMVDRENRVSKEIINTVLKINHPEKDITKPIQEMRALKKWVYPELEELEDVFFKKQASSVYYYTYGARIFNYANTKNQVDDYIIPLLKKNPTSRRAIIVLYHPVVDSKIGMKEISSLISVFFKITDKKLTVSIVIRSNDMFIGWPANIYQVYLLQQYVAKKLGLEPGSITTISHSAHVFEEYKEEVEEVLRKG